MRMSEHNSQRKGYVRLLEEQLSNLEAQIESAGIDVTRSSADGHQGATILDDAPTQSSRSFSSDTRAPPSTSTAPIFNHSVEAADLNMQLLSLSAMAEPNSRAGEFLRELSMPRIIAAVTETYGGNPESTMRVDTLWDGINRYIKHGEEGPARHLFFPRSEATKSLQTYLSLVDIRYPGIPKGDVQHGIDAITEGNDDSYKSTLASDPAKIFMAYMIIAVTPLVSDIYPVAQGSFIATHMLAQSLKLLGKVFQHEDGVHLIHCLRLLVIFSIHSPTAGSSWHLIGIAMKKCIALGYHRVAPASVPAEEAEARRWAFWGCYQLDRLISAALGRPNSLDDRYITVSLPESTDGGQSPNILRNMQVHLFRYAVLMSSAIYDKSRPFEHHLGLALSWRASVKTDDKTMEREASYQKSVYNTLLLRMAIDQVNLEASHHGSSSPQRFDEFTPTAFSAQDDSLRQTVKADMDVVLHCRLIHLCRASINGLGRPEERKRSFLSWITGYSVFSGALGILYYTSLLTLAGSLHIPIIDNAADEILDANQMLNDIMLKLRVVARQFPRMNDFRRIVAALRWKIDGFLLDDWMELDQADLLAQYAMLVDGIGPPHLKSLATKTIALSQLATAGTYWE